MNTHVIHAEWIGKHIRVNKMAIEGIVVDETKNTIVVQTTKGVKTVQKHGNVFEIEGQKVQGDDVLAAPEDRVKIKVN